MLRGISFSIFLALALQGPGSFRFPKEKGLQVFVTGLRNEKGHVLVSLFKEAAGYPDAVSKAYRREKLEIHEGQASILFTELPASSYAIAILHDENDDQRMNKSWLGLPREGYGFSNNVKGFFGPPSYEKASFSYPGDELTQVTIKTRYP